jgi:hypothetical protein
MGKSPNLMSNQIVPTFDIKELLLLNRELIRALAELAARNNDEQLRSLLSANGITFTVEQKPAPAKR